MRKKDTKIKLYSGHTKNVEDITVKDVLMGDKLKKFSLIEYKDPDKLNHEIQNCLVNSMAGKVINT